MQQSGQNKQMKAPYNKKVIIKMAMHGYKVGDVVNVPCDKEGTPLDQQMRRRFKDAKTDGCLMFHDPTSPDLPKLPSSTTTKKRTK